MSTIKTEKRVCDKCGKELRLYPTFKIMIGKPNKITMLSTRHDWGKGYPLDNLIELCPDCTDKFRKFILESE